MIQKKGWEMKIFCGLKHTAHLASNNFIKMKSLEPTSREIILLAVSLISVNPSLSLIVLKSSTSRFLR